MYCKNLSKCLNGKLRCKLLKQIITLDKCKNCSKSIVVRNKPIKKVSNKRITVSKKTYDKVYERDKGCCRLCGNDKIQLHHIIYRSEDKSLIDEPTNCIMLCVKCHKLCHSNKKKYQPILLKMLENTK